MAKDFYQVLSSSLTEPEARVVKSHIFNACLLWFIIGALFVLAIQATIIPAFEKWISGADDGDESIVAEIPEDEQILRSSINVVSFKDIASNQLRFSRDYNGQVITISDGIIGNINEEYFLINGINAVLIPKDEMLVYDLDVGSKYIIQGEVATQNEYNLEFFYIKDVEILYKYY